MKYSPKPLPFDRETIIAVIDWLTSHEDIDLRWTGYAPLDEHEWVNPLGVSIDGETALNLITDPAAFQARAYSKALRDRGVSPLIAKRFREMRDGLQTCEALTAKRRHCRNRVIEDYWDDISTFDPSRPEHRFCHKHLAEGREVHP